MKRKRIRIYTSYKSKKQCSVVFEITYLQHKLLLMEKRKERIDHLEETPNSPLPYSDYGDSMISE